MLGLQMTLIFVVCTISTLWVTYDIFVLFKLLFCRWSFCCYFRTMQKKQNVCLLG